MFKFIDFVPIFDIPPALLEVGSGKFLTCVRSQGISSSPASPFAFPGEWDIADQSLVAVSIIVGVLLGEEILQVEFGEPR